MFRLTQSTPPHPPGGANDVAAGLLIQSSKHWRLALLLVAAVASLSSACEKELEVKTPNEPLATTTNPLQPPRKGEPSGSGGQGGEGQSPRQSEPAPGSGGAGPGPTGSGGAAEQPTGSSGEGGAPGGCRQFSTQLKLKQPDQAWAGQCCRRDGVNYSISDTGTHWSCP